MAKDEQFGTEIFANLLKIREISVYESFFA